MRPRLEDNPQLDSWLSEISADVKVMASKITYIESTLNEISKRVQCHQTWIDQRQGQIILSLGLLTTGITVGGTLVGIVFKLLGK
jgi:tetrahydromethanopterin S-methyltransferase subunit G